MSVYIVLNTLSSVCSHHKHNAAAAVCCWLGEVCVTGFMWNILVKAVNHINTVFWCPMYSLGALYNNLLKGPAMNHAAVCVTSVCGFITAFILG